MKRFTRVLGAGRRGAGGMDFTDTVPLTPNAAAFAGAVEMKERREPGHLQRNKTERRRLQGLMQRDDDKASFAPSATKVSMLAKDRAQQFQSWMVNDGQRRIFFGVWILLHAMVFTFGFLNFQLSDNLNGARQTFGITYPIARASALVLHVDVAFILLPVCRNFITLIRRTPLNGIVPFDNNITFHKSVAWSMIFFAAVHTIAHMVNFGRLAASTDTGVIGFLGANFLTGPGATGWIMVLCLGLMTWFAMEKRRRYHFEKFWYTHHLFIIYFICWQLHGMFCMIKPDREPFCSFMNIGVFWKYWLIGGVIYLGERVLREVRARHRTYVSKVIQHPSKVVEIQIRKEKTSSRSGQYIFLNCPEISYWQWHPFTLTSAPEEDYISIHVRMVGDFTTALGEALGCDLSLREKDGTEQQREVRPPMNRVLPRVMIDGPFGSASEDFYKYETVVLVGAGIGVTPFASTLKAIWYRINAPNQAKRTRLQKVYFVWICRDFESFEWFQSLLMAIEEQDVGNFIEIHTYITSRISMDDMTNITVQDVGGERDAITGLRAPTHYGRPNWDRIFSSISAKHASTDVGVFFCGPKVLGHALHVKCNEYTTGEEGGTRFIYNKENF